jgi:hypothetical protein
MFAPPQVPIGMRDALDAMGAYAYQQRDALRAGEKQLVSDLPARQNYILNLLRVVLMQPAMDEETRQKQVDATMIASSLIQGDAAFATADTAFN